MAIPLLGHGLVIHSLVADPAKSDRRLQPGDELVEVDGQHIVGLPLSECTAIIKGASNTATFRVRKRSGKTTPPATPTANSSGTGIGEVVVMDASLEREVELADVEKSLVQEENGPSLESLVTDRTQFPASMDVEINKDDGDDKLVRSLEANVSPSRETAPSERKTTPTITDPLCDPKSSHHTGMCMCSVCVYTCMYGNVCVYLHVECSRRQIVWQSTYVTCKCVFV